MAKSNNQKAKILFLEQMLRETGENHAVSMQEILDRLAERGIAAERKSIYDDMDALRAIGMDIRFHRGRPGGYFLAGQTAAGSQNDQPDEKSGKEAAGSPETSSADIAENSVAACGASEVVSPAQNTGISVYFEGLVKPGEKKQMLLFCEKTKESQIRAYFGGLAEITAEEPDLLAVEAPLSLDPQFFGWVTAMGTDVHLKKPKKLVQTYRDYLKALTKEYKGIGKKEE